MKFHDTEAARRHALRTLGLDRLVSPAYLDIAAGHRAHADLQRSAATFTIDGLTIEAPAGIYHPTPESSSLMFIRNIQALAIPSIPRMLELGTGCGAIALVVAHRWKGHVVATDISDATLDIARANAGRNGLCPKFVRSDLFASIDERDFDLIVFNTPLIDKAPEDDLERESLCDPGGRILRGYLNGLTAKLAPNGFALFGICCNTAYQQLAEVALDYKTIGMELVGDGFWRAIIAACRTQATPQT